MKRWPRVGAGGGLHARYKEGGVRVVLAPGVIFCCKKAL